MISGGNRNPANAELRNAGTGRAWERRIHNSRPHTPASPNATVRRRMYRALVAGWNPADERLAVAVHQATGMVAEQVDCGIHEAFCLLFAVSSATGQCLASTAPG